MTCIIGLEQNGVAYLGGDSRVSQGWKKETLAGKKVFPVNDCLFGCCGDVRMVNIIQYDLALPKQQINTSDERYIISDVVDMLRTFLKVKGWAKVESNEETMPNSALLIAYHSQIYEVASDFCVTRNCDGVYAVGGGNEYALGAMLALRNLEPQKRIKRALQIAGHYSMGVSRPYYVIEQRSSSNGTTS